VQAHVQACAGVHMQAQAQAYVRAHVGIRTHVPTGAVITRVVFCACTPTHVPTHTYRRIRRCAYRHARVCAQAHAGTRSSALRHVRTHTCTRAYRRTHICAYTRLRAHTCTHVRTHAHMHAHVCACVDIYTGTPTPARSNTGAYTRVGS